LPALAYNGHIRLTADTRHVKLVSFEANLIIYKIVKEIFTIGTMVLAISLSAKNPHTIVMDLTAYSLTTVSSNPANYSRSGNKQDD